jgi:hypothetical protein
LAAAGEPLRPQISISGATLNTDGFAFAAENWNAGRLTVASRITASWIFW